MTKPNSTLIVVILDRSGSMNHIQMDTIGGFNTFLAEQKRNEVDEAKLMLVQFDHEYEVVYEATPLDKVQDLTSHTYVPRGHTALLDAMGKTIHDVGRALAAMPDAERPEQVVVVTITDGEENFSKEFNKQRVGEMIKHQAFKYNWQFVFIGANFDAIGAGVSLGIAASNALNFAASARGMGVMYRAVSDNIGAYRTTKSSSSLSFSAAQRLANDPDTEPGKVVTTTSPILTGHTSDPNT